MKTSVEIPDELFKLAIQFAQRNRTTINALIEDGLCRVLNDQKIKTKTAFKLKDASVRGEAMLITDLRRWQEMEEEHVIAKVKKSLTNSA
jgi:stress response protein SCP2